MTWFFWQNLATLSITSNGDVLVNDINIDDLEPRK